MDRKEYWEKNYFMSAGQSPDVLCVNKSQGTEWCNVTLTVHAEVTADVTIRSKEMAEQLHFMLGAIARQVDNPLLLPNSSQETTWPKKRSNP